MMQDGPWNRYRQQTPPPAPAPQADRIYGAPRQPDPVELQRLGMAQEDQARQNRMAPIQEEAARLEVESKRRQLSRTDTGKALPEGAAKRLEDTIGLYANLKGAAGGFQDEFAGNTLTGGLENTIQGLSNSFGTPGQRDWWANFRTLDNQIRNELFGATLTPSEQAAYAQTSINERMDPKTIRENLTRREKVIRDALSRRTKYLKANGYNSEAIDALTGEFGADFGAPAASTGARDDEQLLFNDEAKPVTGYRFTPEQESQIADAVGVGDEGQVLALMQRFGGGEPTDETRNSVRAAIDAAKRGGKIAINYAGVDKSAQEQADRERFGDNLPAAIEERKSAGLDATVRGIADTGSLGFADELSAAATTLFAGGTMQENLQRERSIDEADRRVNAIPRIGGQFAGAIINPLGRGATTVGEVTRAGAAGGALYGFGSGEDVAGRASGAATGALAGGTGGYLVGRGSNALASIAARRAEARAAEPNALMAAADRQGIQPMPADVGGPFVRRVTAAAAQAPLSASPVIQAGQRVVEQTRAARDRIAASVGRARTPEATGDTIKRGGEAFRAASSARVDAAYRQARDLAENAEVSPQRALQTLYGHIRQLKQDPSSAGSSELAALERLAENLAGRKVSVDGIKMMRTRLRKQYLDEGLRSSDFQRRISEVVDSAAEDVTAGLAEQGLESASTAFSRADQLYRGRVEVLDDILAPIVGGNKSSEQVVQALETATKNNGRMVQGLLKAMPDDERAAVQASIIGRLGVKRGDAEAEDFSLDVFLSQWKAMTPRAKAAIFQGEARSALDDLVKVAEGSRAAASYANRSNTGGAIAGNVGAYIGVGAWAPLTAAFAGLGQYGVGRLMASPGFTRWLTRAPKTDNPRLTRAWINRIPQIPAVRGEIEQLQQRLLANLTQSPSRVNASDREQD
jgi:hypothetical protein